MTSSVLVRVAATARAWARDHQVQRYARNVGWMLITRAVWILSAFTVGVYVARMLGPFKFGILNYALALTGMFSLIATLSAEEVVIRQLLREPGRRDRILGNFFMFRVVLFLVLLILLGGTVMTLDLPSQVRRLCLIIGVGYIGFLAQGTTLYFQAMVDSKYIALPQLTACVLNSAVRLLAAWLNWPLVVFALAEAGNVVIQYWGGVFFYVRKVGSVLAWTWDWAEIRTLLLAALPLAIGSAFSVVYMRVDQVMVGHFLGPEAVGYYALVSRFTENWALVAGLLCQAFFPAVVSAAQVSRSAYHKQIHRLYFLVFWSMAGAATLTVLLGRWVIQLLFGSAYLPSVPILHVFAWTLLGTAMLSVFYQWAVNEGRLRLIAASLGSGVVINIVLNPPLIWLLGISGAAWSSLISMPIGLVLVLLASRDGRGHLRMMLRSVCTLPSFRLGEH